MEEPQSQIVFDEWDTYVSHGEEGPIFISFDDGATRIDLGESLPHCARVIVPIRQPNAAGGPDEPEAEMLWEMEDELCDLLGDAGTDCRLVARLTYAGERELVFQLADWEEFRDPVALWLMQHGEYDVEISEHEGWEFFDDVVRPTVEDRLWMADARVVENLREAGSDPLVEHAIEYVFVGEPDRLERVATALRERGYQPLDEAARPKSTTSDLPQLVMVLRMPLDVDDICEQSIANLRLAEEHGVEYDGWGALVQK